MFAIVGVVQVALPKDSLPPPGPLPLPLLLLLLPLGKSFVPFSDDATRRPYQRAQLDTATPELPLAPPSTASSSAPLVVLAGRGAVAYRQLTHTHTRAQRERVCAA